MHHRTQHDSRPEGVNAGNVIAFNVVGDVGSAGFKLDDAGSCFGDELNDDVFSLCGFAPVKTRSA